MAYKIDSLQIQVVCTIRGGTLAPRVMYEPFSTQGDVPSALTAYSAYVDLAPEQRTPLLQRKLERLKDALVAELPQPPEIELGGVRRRGRPVIRWFGLDWEGGVLHVGVDFYPADLADSFETVRLAADRLSEATIRLIDNLRPTFEQIAWNDLHQRVTGVAPVATSKRKVLISYRSGREAFAEAVAHRLGREGFLPWFDQWEVLAGDSLPREIGEGFRDVYGVILVLTPDYPHGRWAREELETAITKRVEENIRIVPVMYERCLVPELLRSLRYVDCTDHTDDQFERQFKAIIDALNEIEVNPYR